MKDLQNMDRDIDISTRTIKGEFYTPETWVNYSHEFISHLNLSDKVVWDCAWGTGNLTRDFKFGKLFASTLKDEDLIVSKNINIDSEKFQFDFLNDDISDIESKCNLLYNTLSKTDHIYFLINPPYATANKNKKNEVNKTGLSNTKTSEKMKNEKWGGTGQLYTQFLFRINEIKEYFKIKDVKILIFCPPLFLTSCSFKNFRKKFLNEFIFKKGFIFSASEFNDISTDWGICFSVFETGKSNEVNKFKYDVLKREKSGEIKKIREKYLYNIEDKNSFSNVIRNKIKNDKKFISPPFMKSALSYTFEDKKTYIVEECIGVLNSQGNNVKENNQSVVLFSHSGSKIGSIPINNKNFIDCVINFSCRRVISGKKANFYNWYDEYIYPHNKDDYFNTWSIDCLVYSIFNQKSNQSSIKKDNLRIKNQFFWMSKKLISEGIKDDERYVFTFLEENKKYISKIAEEVLSEASKIVVDTLKIRREFNKTNPEFNLDCWDAGWYQIKKIVDSKRLISFQKKYEKLSQEIEKGLYKYNILNDE